MSKLERQTIVAAASGDRQAFAEIYDAYIDKIYAYLYCNSRHRETAEDLASQVFFQAWKNVSSLDPDKQPSSWLYRIARNLWIDHYRSSHRVAELNEAESLADDSDPLSETDNRWRLAQIEKYLKTLDPLQREVVILRVWHDLSYQEIAAVIGKSEAASKMLFARALSKMKENLPLTALLYLLLRI
jgi:RNA polymerase sigma-70 factor (ECF subfamily)